MLERKRILKHRDTVHDEQGNDLLIYEHARTGESFTIPDPRLRLDQLQSIQQQVIALLSPEEEKKPEGEPAAPATGEPPVTPA
jgi:hypothetical protein